MRSRKALTWLVIKEWRELLASRAWWVLLIVMGPLVGSSFIGAVTAYGELSEAGGTGAGVGEAFSPLSGVWAPTFSACELAAAFLLPFVAIRVVSGDRHSGALKIEMQHELSALARLTVKGVVLLGGWLIATAAPVLSVALWLSYGGDVFPPELLSVILGHVINGGLTIALAVAAAAMTEHPATAAIVTLTITVGTWLINFAAAVNGGWWEQAARFTPTAMVAEFQRGLVRADVTLAALSLIVAGFLLASTWLRLGDRVMRRVQRSAMIAVATTIAVTASATIKSSWDASESRQNSFTRAEEAAMRTIASGLRVRAHFAPEDPRRSDLEYRGLRKLRRAMPDADVAFVSKTSTGLFEQASEMYGQVIYELDGRSVSSRVITAEGVRDSVLELAGVSLAASQTDDDVFRGHPLAARPRGAAATFYVAWPLVAAGLAFYFQWRKV